MGRPKLSLPLGERTVIEHVLGRLREAEIQNVLVVAGPHVAELIPLAAAAGASVLLLEEPTEDMRATVEAGLNWIESNWRPTDSDAILLVPADHPLLCANIVMELVSIVRSLALENRARGDILIPTCNGRRGHPTLIGWRHVAGIRALPGHLGLNAYLRQHPEAVREVPVLSETVLLDLDTLEDYERIKGIVARG
jgi:molybdenum cofactor cytidylyltransferase